MQAIPVRLADRSYDILVGAGLIKELESHLKRAGLAGPFLVVSQPRIARALQTLIGKRLPIELIPDGERAKKFATVSRLMDRLAAGKITRQGAIIALGGGVVGDVAGFAASIYMRGIAVVQVPTTLLAQVDSSIGGKTGVNHHAVKNLVGTFHQPRMVLADSATLTSLPFREYASGLFEVLKYGVIEDPILFENVATRLPAILRRDGAAVEEIVARCAAIKARIVAADEREGDLRRVLNLGHTVGHALEAAAGMRKLKHGEAVGYGLIAAARISAAMGRMARADAQRVEAVTLSIGTLPGLAGVEFRPVMNALGHDKKVRDGALHFVLPREIGRVEITRDVPVDLVRNTVRSLLHEFKTR